MAFKLFPKTRRLPTLLGLLILLVGVAVTTYLTQSVQKFLLKAEPIITPQSVKISNVTAESFTVSWMTPGNSSSGYLNYGSSSSLGKATLDERDQKIEKLGSYFLHHVTATGLAPKTTYYFKIVSQGKEYDQNGKVYTVQTAPTNYSTSLAPTYGIVLEENGQPVQEGIVYVKIGNSDLLSTPVKSSGNWLVSLSSLGSQDLNKAFEAEIGDFEEIFVQGKEKTSQIFTSLDNNAPVPEITLGKNYDFRVSATPTPPLFLATSPLATPSLSLIHPATGSAIPDQPFFRGNGVPGQTIKITIESPGSINGETTVDSNGNWAWQVPENLAVGEHTVTITTTDNAGQLQAIVRKFTILPSGVRVAEAATPSATPTVTVRPSPTPTSRLTTTPTPTSRVSPTPTPTVKSTATPTPTVKPTASPTATPSPTRQPTLTLSPTPQATGAAIPESGDLLFTLLLGAAGFTFITLGFVFLRPKKIEGYIN